MPDRPMPPIPVETFPGEPIKQSQSGTIKAAWAGIALSVVGVILGATKLSADDRKTVMDFIEFLLPYVGTAGLFVATWYHRMKADRAIKGGAGDPQVKAMEEIRRQRFMGG